MTGCLASRQVRCLVESNRPTGPRPDPVEPLDANACDVSGGRILEGREFCARTHVGYRKPLEELSAAAFLNEGKAIDNHVFGQAHGALRVGMYGDGDARGAADVLDLLVLGDVAGDDLIAVQPDPNERDLGAPR